MERDDRVRELRREVRRLRRLLLRVYPYVPLTIPEDVYDELELDVMGRRYVDGVKARFFTALTSLN